MASNAYDDFGLRIARTGEDGSVLNFTIDYALPLPSVATVQNSTGDMRYYLHTLDGTLLYSIEAARQLAAFLSFRRDRIDRVPDRR